MSTLVKEYAPLNYLTAVEQLGRTPRPGQQKLVETGVDLEVGETRLVKAPTATGKSLGALMIAGFRWNLDPENKTVIATYTRLLQDQYGKSKDMDQARELFPDMVFAVLKGANNYLCRAGARRFTAIHEDYQKLADGEGDPGELAGRTHLWKAKADTRTCGKHTPEVCGFAAAKARAKTADCVVTNHALVMVNSVNTNVFGQHSLLIVDECFVPEALVDTPSGPRPIGDLVVGDEIYGYDETRGIVELTTVKATMSRESPVLGGFVTANHPVRTADAYRAVADLTPEDTIVRLDLSGVPTVRHSLLRDTFGSSNTPGWSKVLLSGLLDSRPSQISQGSSKFAATKRTAGRQREAGCSSLASLEPVVRSSKPSQSSSHTGISGLGQSSRRQWSADDRSSQTALVGTGRGLAARGDHPYQGNDRSSVTSLVQRGFSTPGQAAGSGSRRTITLNRTATGRGSQEGFRTALGRMDGSEIHQPRDLGRYRRVRDANTDDRRTVVNIETGTNNYFVEGILVHNCHNFPRAAESFATEEINFNDVEDELRKSKSYEAVDGQRFLAQVRTMIPPGSGFSDRKPTGEELVKVATLFDQKPWAKSMPELTPIYDWTVSAIQYIRKENPPRLALIAPQPWKARTPNLILRHAEIDISVAAQRGLATQLGEITEEHGDQRFERAVLMMSATTGTPSKPTYVADRCGVQADLVKVDSALDYPGQMRMTLQNLPNGFTYESATVRLCTETSGRTLVLCRSWKMVDAIYDELRAANPGFRVFKQDRDEPTNNGYLVRQFTADTSSVLVGTASFFEGIDVPGEALSQVIVTQLPMLMDFESNPLGWERKNRAGSRYIPDMQIPATALILEQMFGRLIRSTQDRGLVVVLDSNATRGWGQRATLDAIRSFEVPVVARRDALAWFAS